MQKARSIGSLSLALLMLIASVGVTVNLHFCGGELRTYALYEKTKACHEVKKMACHDSVENHKGCCDESSIVIKSDDNSQKVENNVKVHPSFTLAAVILPVLYTLTEIEPVTVSSDYAHYKPPLPVCDITVFTHSFII